MSIPSTTVRQNFITDAVTKVFGINIQAYLAVDFLVYLTLNGVTTLLVLNGDYSLAPASSDTPPKWTLTTLAANAFAAGTLQVVLNPAQTQQTNYASGQSFPSLAVQQNVDRLTQMIQRLADRFGRAVMIPDSEINAVSTLPGPATRANLALIFDANGQPTVGLIPTGPVVVFGPANPGIVPASLGGNLHFVRADGSWTLPFIAAQKVADEPRTVANLLTNDGALSVVIPQAGTYRYELMAYPFQALAGAYGIQCNLNFSAGYDAAASLNCWDLSGTTQQFLVNSGVVNAPGVLALSMGAFNTVRSGVIRCVGTLVSTAGGVLSFAWCQNAADGVHATSVGRGSFLKANPMA